MNSRQRVHRAMGLARFVLDPRNLAISVEKVRHRSGATAETADAHAWAESVAVSSDSWIRERDPALADEALTAVAAAEADAEQRLKDRPPLGGAGACALLYWLVRKLEPGVVVETGVAAGWSSLAVLSALEANGKGRLLSSDLPYPGLSDAAAHVGVAVPDDLRDRWRLDLDGDAKNLPRFARVLDHIDLFHFDSDKSRAGRDRALRLLSDLLDERSVIVMDDISDNLWFRDWVASTGEPYVVLRLDNKHVGIATRRPGLEIGDS